VVRHRKGHSWWCLHFGAPGTKGKPIWLTDIWMLRFERTPLQVEKNQTFLCFMKSFGMLPYLNMPSFSHKAGKYIRVHTKDDSLNSDSESEMEKLPAHTERNRRRSTTINVLFIIVIILLATVALAYLQLHDHITSPASVSCQNPSLRQEWRSFSIEEQYDYINAAQCLRDIPSRLHNGMSLYDDFPFLHDVVGDYGM